MTGRPVRHLGFAQTGTVFWIGKPFVEGSAPVTPPLQLPSGLRESACARSFCRCNRYCSAYQKLVTPWKLITIPHIVAA